VLLGQLRDLREFPCVRMGHDESESHRPTLCPATPLFRPCPFVVTVHDCQPASADRDEDHSQVGCLFQQL